MTNHRGWDKANPRRRQKRGKDGKVIHSNGHRRVSEYENALKNTEAAWRRVDRAMSRQNGKSPLPLTPIPETPLDISGHIFVFYGEPSEKTPQNFGENWVTQANWLVLSPGHHTSMIRNVLTGILGFENKGHELLAYSPLNIICASADIYIRNGNGSQLRRSYDSLGKFDGNVPPVSHRDLTVTFSQKVNSNCPGAELHLTRCPAGVDMSEPLEFLIMRADAMNRLRPYIQEQLNQSRENTYRGSFFFQSQNVPPITRRPSRRPPLYRG